MPRLNKNVKVVTIAFIAVVGILLLMTSLSGGQGGLVPFGGAQPQKLELGEFKSKVREGQVREAAWQQKTIRGKLEGGKEYVAQIGFTADSNAGAELLNLLDDNGTDYKTLEPPAWQAVGSTLLFLIFPLALIGFLIFVYMKNQQGGGAQAMNFGRSRAKRAGESTPKVTFKDVAGIDEARQELFEIVDYLKSTKKYVALGAKIPKGILLTGPPGVGKTHLSRAIAGEAGVPFFHISGSDFVEMFVGVGAARVRDLFETAKAHKPSLIFIDEIDAVGRQRGAGLGGGHDEREQTLNQLLVEMDGFDPNSGVILIAATNRPDVLDPALLRPGRFDRQIVVDPPDATGREAILRIHSEGKPISEHVDLATLAKRTPGFTGADLANALNEAALLAARNRHTQIEMDDLEEALDRVIAGPQRRSKVIDQREREIIAYHEAGHAIVGEVLEHSDPVHKVTILPRGMSLGATWSLPDKDSYLVSENKLMDSICTLLGGRVAEDLVFNEVTTGASNDLERVTRTARAMVTKYGMSDAVGNLAIGNSSSNPFLGKDYHEEMRDYSESVAELVDTEVRKIVSLNYERAEQILREHREKLNLLADTLLDRETIDREEFLAIMEGRPLPDRPDNSDDKGMPEETEERDAGLSPNNPRLEPGTA